MDNKLLNEINAAVGKIPASEKRTFQTTKEFYDFLKTQGVTASLEDVKNILIDMSKQQSKQELSIENFDDIVGGAQVEVKNTVKYTSNSVNVGSTVVINM